MKTGIADRLLARLNEGDHDAAAELFRRFEPCLRLVVRRKLSAELRAKFDSCDIVQSVWVDVVEGLRESKWTFGSIEQLRAFLVKMTRNRFIDRVRQHRGSLERERSLPSGDLDLLAGTEIVGASENVRVEELWNLMLGACPPARRDVLRLKRDGASLDEIAARTGIHKGSVRRILYDVGRQVARRTAWRKPR